MGILGTIATGLVGTLHVYIMSLEMFMWTSPRGRQSFNLTPEFAEKTKVMAANQGLYNGFLAAGLCWGLVHPIPEVATQIRIFFLSCVGVAGFYGGVTTSKRIIYVQAVPAVVSIAMVMLGL